MLEPAQGSAKSHFSLPSRAAPPLARREAPIDPARDRSDGEEDGGEGGHPRGGDRRGERPSGSLCSCSTQPWGTAGEVRDGAWGQGDPSGHANRVPSPPQPPPSSWQLPEAPPAQGRAGAAADTADGNGHGHSRSRPPLRLAPSSPPKKNIPSATPGQRRGRAMPRGSGCQGLCPGSSSDQ